MPVVSVYDIEKNKVAEVSLSDAVFGAEVNQDVIYEVVRMQMAAKRQGTHDTKERSEIRGGGKKPWRQKGTGRARAGTIRSPLWRGGGTVFGPTPRDHSYTVPKKVRRLALISALSMKVKEEKLLVIKDFPLAEVKTKKFKRSSTASAQEDLVVIDRASEFLEKSSRNLPDVKMMRCEGINVYDLLKYDSLVLLEPSIQKIEGALT
jgi:large subunit ribosomal protein L4